MFTDHDEPSSEEDRKACEKKAEDLAAIDVEIELLPLPAYDQATPNFEFKKFFASLITFEDEEMSSSMLKSNFAEGRLDDLMKRIKQKEFKRRVKGKCEFEISKDTKIALSFF